MIATTGHVLVVDDEVEILQLLREGLEFENYPVLTAPNSLAAIEVLKQESVDVLVTDLKMPGMDGVTLISKALEIFPELQAIIITGHSDTESAIESLNLGAAGYLRKPLNLKELCILVSRCFEKIGLKRALYQKNRELAFMLKERDTILSSMKDLLIVTTSYGTVRMANTATLRMLNCSEDYLVGKSIEQFISQSGENPIASFLDLLNHNDGNYYHEPSEAFCLAQSGEKRELLISGSPMHDEENQIVWVAKDITDLKQAQREASERGKQLTAVRQSLFRDRLEHPEVFSNIITQSRKMETVFQYIEAVAPFREPLLILGETGVGKDLLAEAVHQLSGQVGQWVTVNLVGLDSKALYETLLGRYKDSGLVEYEGGFAKANHGTLFFSEIADLPMEAQGILLQFLKEGRYYPLDSNSPRTSTARVVCATRKDLKQRVDEGKFRSDLYQRLSTHQTTIPPLRERKEDILLLLGHLLEEVSEKQSKPIPDIPSEVLDQITALEFHENVKTLRKMVEEAMAKNRGEPFSAENFKETVPKRFVPVEKGNLASTEENPFRCIPGKLPSFQEADKYLIQEALRRTKQNKSLAASLLGISRQALHARLRNFKKEKEF